MKRKCGVDVKRIGDRILDLKFMVTQESINIIGAYETPQVGSEALVKEIFWKDLEGFQSVAQDKKIFFCEDLNGIMDMLAIRHSNLKSSWWFSTMEMQRKTKEKKMNGPAVAVGTGT